MIAMQETPDSRDQRLRAQRGRNRALALVLVGFAILLFFITIAKIQG